MINIIKKCCIAISLFALLSGIAGCTAVISGGAYPYDFSAGYNYPNYYYYPYYYTYYPHYVTSPYHHYYYHHYYYNSGTGMHAHH